MTPFNSGYGQALNVIASSETQKVFFQGQTSWIRIKAVGSITLYFNDADAETGRNGYPLNSETLDGPLKAGSLWIEGSGQVNILAYISVG